MFYIASYFAQYDHLSDEEVIDTFSDHLRSIDINDDKKISLNEMNKWVTSDAEFDASLLDDEATSSLFFDTDTNKDWQISVEEMLEKQKQRLR